MSSVNEDDITVILAHNNSENSVVVSPDAPSSLDINHNTFVVDQHQVLPTEDSISDVLEEESLINENDITVPLERYRNTNYDTSNDNQISSEIVGEETELYMDEEDVQGREEVPKFEIPKLKYSTVSNNEFAGESIADTSYRGHNVKLQNDYLSNYTPFEFDELFKQHFSMVEETIESVEVVDLPNVTPNSPHMEHLLSVFYSSYKLPREKDCMSYLNQFIIDDQISISDLS
jgi:hypothetical protein